MKNDEEERTQRLRFSYLELLSNALKQKGIDNWYFGLHTALSLNNMVDQKPDKIFVILDRFFRNKTFRLNGRIINLIRFKNSLFYFGIIDDGIRYSDPNKTVLDLAFLWDYNGEHKAKVLVKMSEYDEYLSKDKLLEYGQHYPKKIQRIADEYTKR